MNAIQNGMMQNGSNVSEETLTEQELVIRPNGQLEIPWITPRATSLVLEVYRAVSDEPFPVRVISGNIYCG